MAELGDWKIDEAPSMVWNEGSYWTLDLELPAGSDLEFKVWIQKQNHTRTTFSANPTKLFKSSAVHYLTDA